MSDRGGAAAIVKALSYALMALAVIIIGLPLLWMLFGSLKTTQEIYTMPPPWLPQTWR